jgi:lipopolysaccharide export system permease protein
VTFFSATDRYLARLIFLPLMGSLVVAAMLLVLDRMLRLFDFVASEGGPVSVVWRMLANLLPEYLSLGIPIGLLLGILLAFRRLAMSSELDVLQAVGQSYNRMLYVPYLYTIGLALVNLAIVGYVQPKARFAYEELRYELRSGALGASIKVGEFNRLGKDMTLRIDKSADDLPIDLPKMEAFRPRGQSKMELTLPELVKTGRDPNQPVATRYEARSNFHYRMAEVLMMFLLPLLAVALAVPPKRSASALGVFVSIIMVVTYHKINEYAAGMGELGRIDPFFALWIPFALFAALIVWMYYTIAFVPGGQPIGGLERVSAKALKAIRNMFASKR